MNEQPDDRRYAQAKEILQRAIDLEPGERPAYLEAACGADDSLRAEVASLLAAFDDANSSFLDSPLALTPHAAEVQGEDLDLTGKRVGAYRLERLLGRGGMGAVYLASRDDGEFTRHVAIKFIRKSRVSPALLKRFKTERQILADIDHPNIARLIDGGTAEGMPFFVMEYVSGDTLAQALGKGPLPLPSALRLARGVAEVLEAIHARGLVFRDLKPSNIILNDDSGVKVLDFGIAKLMHSDTGEETTRTTLTGPGWIIGSPRYMSPEQASGDAVDARSDIFSFGLVMYEALTGKLPFDGATRKDYLKHLIASEAAPLPSPVPARLRGVIERCLKKEPAERYASGGELAAAVRALVAPPPKRFFESPAAWVALAIAATAAVGYGFWLESRRQPAVSSAPLLTGPTNTVVTWASNETNPRISPDSKWISFLSDRDGTMKIWLTNRSAHVERSIAPLGGTLRSHEWSPASDQIAYVATAGGRANLIVTPIADGGKPVVYELRQADVSLVRWYAQGIYYLSESSLWRFDPAAARATEVTTGRGALKLLSADVSADERRLVFTALKDGVARIWSSGLDASAPVSVTEARINPKSVRWKGAAARDVVYVSEESDMVDIWQVNVTSKHRQRLTATEYRERGLDVSADGAALLYEQVLESAHLAVFNPDDARLAPTLITSDSLSDMFPASSSSGRDVVFQRSKGIMTGGLRNVTIRVSQDGFRTEPRIIGEGFGPEISADGRWAVYPDPQPQPLGNLWLVDLGKPGSQWLISDVFRRSLYSNFPQNLIESALAWSNQGALYFRARGRSGGTDIWQVEPVPGRAPAPAVQLTDLADASEEVFDVRVSGDGSRVSYLLRSKGRATTELHVLDVTRKRDEVKLAEPAGFRLSCPGWLSDGSIVVLRTDVDTVLTDVILVRGGAREEVGRLRDLTWGSAALDSRRRKLYFTRDVGVVHSLHVLALDPGAPREEKTVLTSEPNSPAFSGIRVLDNGQLLFALPSLNSDILLNTFVK